MWPNQGPSVGPSPAGFSSPMYPAYPPYQNPAYPPGMNPALPPTNMPYIPPVQQPYPTGPVAPNYPVAHGVYPFPQSGGYPGPCPNGHQPQLGPHNVPHLNYGQHNGHHQYWGHHHGHHHHKGPHHLGHHHLRGFPHFRPGHLTSGGGLAAGIATIGMAVAGHKMNKKMMKKAYKGHKHHKHGRRSSSSSSSSSD